MGLGRHRAGHLGAEPFQLVLGHVPAHRLQGAGQHPGLPGQRQAFDRLALALPMHAELTQLRLDGQGTLHVGRLVEEIAQAFRRSLGQTLHLA